MVLKRTRRIARQYGWIVALKILIGNNVLFFSRKLDELRYSKMIHELSGLIILGNINLKIVGIDGSIPIYLPTFDAGLSKDILTYGIREPIHTKALYKLINGHSITRILDIGSNVGYFPLIELYSGAKKLICIEPIPITFKYLKLNLKEKCRNCTLINALVDTNSGIRKIYVPFDKEMRPLLNLASINKFLLNQSSRVSTVKGYTTKAIAFNKIINDYKVDMIRMDIEGYEWFLFESADNIPREIYAIDIEIHKGTKKVIMKALQNLLSNGFNKVFIVTNPKVFTLITRFMKKIIGLNRGVKLINYIEFLNACASEGCKKLEYPFLNTINEATTKYLINNYDAFMRYHGNVQAIFIRNY